MPRGLKSEWGGWKLTTLLPGKLSRQKLLASALQLLHSRKVWHNLFSWQVCFGAVAFVSSYLYCLLCTFELWQRFAFSIRCREFCMFLVFDFRQEDRRERGRERKGWCYYKHCVLKLTCALIVMNVRRLRSLVDGFVTCGKQRIMNLSSRLSFCHSLVCIFGIQIQMKKSEWAMPRKNLSWPSQLLGSYRQLA